VGDEGGFATPITKVHEAMDFLVLAVERSGYAKKIVYGLDCAATHLYNEKTKKYTLEGVKLTTDELLDYYKDLIKKYPIKSIEDPFAEDDIKGFVRATKELGIQIIGDDFFCTNPDRIRARAPLGAADALLWKFNQIGTLSEALDAAELAYRQGFGSWFRSVRERPRIPSSRISSSVSTQARSRQVQVSAEKGPQSITVSSRSRKSLGHRPVMPDWISVPHFS
jgi:enolase